MTVRWALLFVVLAVPASAGTLVNSEAVAACLMNAPEPARCSPTILAPCKHLTRAGLQRTCFARLRHRWERLAAENPPLEARGQALPIIAIREGCDARIRTKTDNAGHSPHIARNACRLIKTARWWFDGALHTDRLGVKPGWVVFCADRFQP